MKKLLGIVVLFLIITTTAYSDVKSRYSIGERINNKVILDNKISVKLSDGEWVIVERTGWRWGNYIGQYIFLVKNIKKEIAETISLGFLNTGGKRMADINSYLYEVVFLNKHDGCYGRPEYYKLELFHKGAAINCMIISHIDVNKEIYNPDDKKLAYLNANTIKWIDENSIDLPKIMLSSDHIFFSRQTSSKFYTLNHNINPKFYNGPKTEFITEETSEYHPFNIDKHPKHEKFMNKFISSESSLHMNIEESIGIKRHQKLQLSKYINKKAKIKKEVGGDIVFKISELNVLYKSGALTKEEFIKAKKKLLN